MSGSGDVIKAAFVAMHAPRLLAAMATRSIHDGRASAAVTLAAELYDEIRRRYPSAFGFGASITEAGR